MGNMIELVMQRILNAKDYPDQDSIYIVFSLSNRDKLFGRARRIVINANVNFQISYKDRYIISNRKRVYFINDLGSDFLWSQNQIETFFYDDAAVVRSRPFFYKVRPKLHYRYVQNSTYQVE
jgi:hypothetical protein